MKNCRFTDMKIMCIILGVFFWGILVFCKLAGIEYIAKVIPEELLLKYDNLVVYGAFFILALIAFRKQFFSAVKDFKDNRQKYEKLIIVTIIITIVLMVASAIILSNMGVGDSNNEKSIEKSLENNGFMEIIVACFLGPVVEEVFYRGILFEFLNGKDKHLSRSIAAVILTSLFFAFMHVSLGNFTVTDMLANIPILMLGLTVTTLYWKTENIICPILVHIAMNTIATMG